MSLELSRPRNIVAICRFFNTFTVDILQIVSNRRRSLESFRQLDCI